MDEAPTSEMNDHRPVENVNKKKQANFFPERVFKVDGAPVGF